MYDEEVEESTQRIARAGFFTNRNDIPKLQIDDCGNYTVMLRGQPLGYNFTGVSKSNSREKKLVLSDSSYMSDDEQMEEDQNSEKAHFSLLEVASTK